MNSAVFVGCLIVQRKHAWADNPESKSYRGVDRDPLIADDIDADGRPFTDWRADVCSMLRRERDVFDFIPSVDAALRIAEQVSRSTDDYELIACAVSSMTLDAVLAASPVELLGYEPDVDERNELETALARLRSRPEVPSWDVLGYDVAVFGHDFYSVIFEELLTDGPVGKAFGTYRSKLNNFGLFSSQRQATGFLRKYGKTPHGAEHLFAVYEVLSPEKRHSCTDKVGVKGVTTLKVACKTKSSHA